MPREGFKGQYRLWTLEEYVVRARGYILGTKYTILGTRCTEKCSKVNIL